MIWKGDLRTSMDRNALAIKYVYAYASWLPHVSCISSAQRLSSSSKMNGQARCNMSTDTTMAEMSEEKLHDQVQNDIHSWEEISNTCNTECNASSFSSSSSCPPQVFNNQTMQILYLFLKQHSCRNNFKYLIFYIIINIFDTVDY